MRATMAIGALLAATAARAEDEKMRALDLPAFAKVIAGHKGKPVAVDFWATWCVPCREKFPKFLALAAKHKGKAEFLTVSVDDADAHEEAVKFLLKQKANVACYRLTNDLDEIGKAIDVKSVPRYLVYDSAGVVKFSGDDLGKAEAALAELLGK